MVVSDNHDLMLSLCRAQRENEVVQLLRDAGLWSDDKAWRPFGGIANNFGTIGNQQSDSRGALVEKLVNCVDHMLLRECLRRQIDPAGPSAPKTMQDAAELFFGVPGGNLALFTDTERTRLAEDSICLAISGDKPPGFPTVSVVDRAEGQEPGAFERTFLDLHGSNKQAIPFVQGKFHMGSTGVLPYCSPQHNLQLIASRRDPDLLPTDKSWGFTIVRRRRPVGTVGTSRYEFLAPEGSVCRVVAERLPLWPSDSGEEWLDMPFGSFIRLYEYQIPERTMAHTDLYRALSRRLFRMVLPIRVYEHRDYRSHTASTTLAGMAVRLDQDRSSALEEGFPSSAEINFPGVGPAKVLLALFKADQDTDKWMKGREAVVFTINGQAHAFLSRDFFIRKGVNLRWIAQELLIEIDCSAFSAAVVEQVFMPSRDRMRESEEQGTIERELEAFLKRHDGLREWNERRHQEAVKQSVESDEDTLALLEQLVTSNKEVAALLFPGVRLSDPSRRGIEVSTYRGKRFPTYLRIANGKTRPYIKQCPSNSYCRVEFETDAENDYFVRPSEPGDFMVSRPDLVMGKSLWNGVLTLTLKPSPTARVGDRMTIEATLTTPDGGLKEEFVLQIGPPQAAAKSRNGQRKPKGAGLGLPQIHEVFRSNWARFRFDDDDVGTISRDDGKVESFVNMDNSSLLRFCYGNTRTADFHKHQFKVATTVIALALESSIEAGEIAREDARQTMRQVGRIILPLINTLGDIDE